MTRKPFAGTTLAAIGAAVTMASQPLAAAGGSAEETHLTLDQAGILASVSTGGFSTGDTNGFRANLGTNGRTCATCHVEANAWTFTPRHARKLSPGDPLFAPVDGSDCPPMSASQQADSALSTQVLDYGLIRIELAIPSAADFSLAAATNPQSCLIPPGSAAIAGKLFLFRRPLPTANLIFDSAIMWDGRESLPPLTERVTTQANLQNLAPLLFDLADQANGATTGHAQGTSIAGTPAQADIVAFETSLYTAQVLLLEPRQGFIASLSADGAHGGADYLGDTVAPAFFIGVNDPLEPGFTPASFDLFAAWEPTSPQYSSLPPAEQAVGRGEAVFNNTTFMIHDVPGLNSDPKDPLYNPQDPLAGQDIRGGCATCHNTPNVGNHSTALPINIGVTLAQPLNNDGSPNDVLDIGHLPVYELKRSASGASVRVTDPGKALLSGKWIDIGKTKGPMLRGLAGRAPYFHNGSAKDLATVVRFYDKRFNIGFTPEQMSDLVAFLNSL
jgi:hypothetical protein